MSQIITRFAPSPTGNLHIGNVRTALINYLYAKKYGGKFLLRMDDTDLARSKEAYKESIINDLKWLGIEFDEKFQQSERLALYEKAKNELLKAGRLYACYETPEELEIKRKLQLSRGLPPLYDRSALNLTKEQITTYQQEGRKPHYRFLIKEEEIKWLDLVKGEIKYHGSNLSDPIIIRADGSMTYMLCSTIDDIAYHISHIIRGEDHVSNTAIQIQMFAALSHPAPTFGHLSLVKAKAEKISKRLGGFEISKLRQQDQIEAMTINSFLALIGSSGSVAPYKSMQELINNFDINKFSKSPTTYLPEELELLNQKLLLTYEYEDIKNWLQQNQLEQLDEKFWLAVRPNLQKLADLKDWWQICYHFQPVSSLDTEFLNLAAKYLPNNINEDTWQSWTKDIAKHTGRHGRDLYMPLRLALTGKTSGPELKNLLPLLSRQEIINRLEI